MAVVSAGVAAAAYGAYSSNKAAKEQSSAIKSGLNQTNALAQQSRSDAINLYNQGKLGGQRGLSAAFDFYKQAAPSRFAPVTQSGLAAQRVIGQGAQQANNAILGLPVDMSFANPQEIKPDLSYLSGARLPQMTGEYLPADGSGSIAQPSQMAGEYLPADGDGSIGELMAKYARERGLK